MSSNGPSSFCRFRKLPPIVPVKSCLPYHYSGFLGSPPSAGGAGRPGTDVDRVVLSQQDGLRRIKWRNFSIKPSLSGGSSKEFLPKNEQEVATRTHLGCRPALDEKLGKREGQTGGMRKVGLAGVEREPERLECGTGSFLIGPGCDLVSPDGVNHDVDRAFLVESRGKERGGRELLGQGKGKPFFFLRVFSGRS